MVSVPVRPEAAPAAGVALPPPSVAAAPYQRPPLTQTPQTRRDDRWYSPTPLKIGVATDIASRIASMRTANSRELVLLGILLDAGPDEERSLHQRWSHIRIRGEWFRDTPELRRFISQTTREMDLERIIP